MGSSRKFNPDEEDSTEFLISREALDKISEACKQGTQAHGDEFYELILKQIETAVGNCGGT